jgi:hypothetical protein
MNDRTAQWVRFTNVNWSSRMSLFPVRTQYIPGAVEGHIGPSRGRRSGGEIFAGAMKLGRSC